MPDDPFKRVHSTKFLGVIFDENISFEFQTNDMTRRLSKLVTIMPKLKGI